MVRAMATRLTRDMMREAARIFGREGGKKRKAKLSPEERKAIASRAARARWAKVKVGSRPKRRQRRTK
jgi:hypothetical protein